ncbi:MAG: Mur ligase family protein [Candidatus Cryosericum sp.]
MTGFTLVAAIVAAGTAITLMMARVAFLLHMLQLEEYDTRRFAAWLATHTGRLVADPALDILGLLGVAVLLVPVKAAAPMITVSVVALVAGLMGIGWERHASARSPVKKPLVMTARAWRLTVGAGMIAVGACSALFAARQERVALAIALLLPLSAPLVVIAARTILEPVEALIRRWYVQDAQRTLKGLSPIVVGITGSYGKTSTKFFVEHLLKQRYRVLMTPESYNTAMGICRVIRGQLGPEHEVFVVELAENERGGLGYLLSLVPCTLSVVTSVGLQHLEEFGSKDAIERVMRGFVSMPASGSTVILNGDDAVLSDMGVIAGKRIVRTSADGSHSSDLHAEEVAMTANGLSFTMVTAQDERFPVHTSLLGRHNVANILLAAAVARELEVPWSTIQENIATLRAPPHRLQTVASSGGVRIIDDAFNANPAGFAMAMEVLAVFSPRRILVTPGLVSLGQEEESANFEAGRRAAAAADKVVLVGPKKTRPVREGLLAAGFREMDIMTVRSLEEVTQLLQSILSPGDTVLFENDLPDTFNE